MYVVSAATSYLQGKILNHAFRNTAYSPAATVYVGLCTTPDGVSEVTGTGYARKAISWSAASGFQIASSADITWTSLAAAWGDIYSVGIWDALTAGNQLAFGALATAQTTAAGQTLTLPSGKLIVGMWSTTYGYPTTTYFATKVLDLVFRNTAWTSPAAVYGTLFTDVSAASEVVATGYARQALTFAAPVANSIVLSANANFTVTASYGTVSSGGISDASTSGNLLLWAPLDHPVSTNAGDTVRFDTGANKLTVAID